MILFGPQPGPFIPLNFVRSINVNKSGSNGNPKQESKNFPNVPKLTAKRIHSNKTENTYKKAKQFTNNMSGAGPSSQTGDGDPDQRIVLWNTLTRRKAAGRSVPKPHNLSQYLALNPHMEIYTNQIEQLRARETRSWMDSDISPQSATAEGQTRVPLWNKVELRRSKENGGPMRKNLERYLKVNPEWEVYESQQEALDGLRLTRISLWHRIEKKKLRLSECPLGKEVKAYLDDYPQWEIFYGQDGKKFENGSYVDTNGYQMTPNGTVVMWDSFTRKIVPPSECPLLHDMDRVISANENWEVYKGQDKIPPVAPARGSSGPTNKSYKRKSHQMGVDGSLMDCTGHVVMWDRTKKKKLSGNAAPLRSNIERFIQRNPNFEVFRGQTTGDTALEASPQQSGSQRPQIPLQMRGMDIDQFLTTNNPLSNLTAGDNIPSKVEESGDPNADIDSKVEALIDKFIDDYGR